jgi:RND superfamily putative drug exporter
MDRQSGGLPSHPFGRLGRFVYRRRKIVIALWVIALVALVPIIAGVAKSTSLQLGSAGSSSLESNEAAALISSQFGATVPNSTLVIVISGSNVTTPAVQGVVQGLVDSVTSSKSVAGLVQIEDVYSKLYAAVGSVNSAAYAALDGADLTTQLLLGVPALYLQTWVAAYGSSSNVTFADSYANATAAGSLAAANSTAYRLYSSHVLASFYAAWVASFSSPPTASLGPPARAAYCAQTADSEYIASQAGAAGAFDSQVLKSITMADYLADTQPQGTARLQSFAVGYVSNQTGLTTEFVSSASSLGKTYGDASLQSLVGGIVWDPGRYGLSPGLGALISSLVSPSRSTMIVSLGLNESSNGNIVAVRALASDALESAPQGAGVQSVLVTGQDAISYDFGNSIQTDIMIIFVAAVVLLIVATGIFFRSLLTPFVTLGTIGLALGISQVFIVAVSSLVAKVDFTVPAILLTVIIGVGTDYTVFIMARFREERVRGNSVEDSIETSVTWAGESIATSGATVIISFLALALTSVVLLKSMGVVVGLGVAVALAAALTLVPAVVGVVGERAFWPTSGVRFSHYAASVKSKLQGKRGYFSRSGRFAVKRATALIVLAIIVTVPAVYVYANTTPTYDFLSAAPSSLQSISASNQLAAAFGSGKLFPTYVVVTFASPLAEGSSFNSTELATVGAMSSYVAGYGDVSNVTGPTRPFGSPVNVESINASSPAGVAALAAAMDQVGRDGKTALITVSFGSDPFQAAAISDTQQIRQYLHSHFGASQGVTGVYVGGSSGSILDTKDVFDSEFNSVVPIVAVGVALVLLAVLGSLFLSVFAVFSVLMSIVWTLAATKLVFQSAFNYQILFITPFFLFVTLLGLGMDYNIFILTRIREEAAKHEQLNDAIIHAVEQTGGIITAAAIILAGSLGSLMLSSDLLLRQMGFAFAYSVLIDALVVRTYLVPAVMSKVGRWNWYSPIPHLDRSRALFDRKAKDTP